MNGELLHKYLSGESNAGEQLRMEHWLQADKKHQNFLNSLKKVWEVEPDDEIDVDASKAWNSFQHKLEKEEEKLGYTNNLETASQKRKLSVRHEQKKRLVVTAYAAVAVILIAGLFYHFMPAVSSSKDEIAGQRKVQKISTQRGQRSTFRLADGTQVQLNVNSQIKISPGFGKTNRRIKLKGQAYFNVTRNPDLPFIVQAKGAFTKVLGTKFDVKAYSKEVQVAVKEGRVMLGSSDRDETKELANNQMGTIDMKGITNVVNIRGALEKYLGWKDGRLVFESTPFKKIIPQLERWYNIQVKADSQLAKHKVTATFDNEPMLEVLKVLALSMDAKFKRDGRNVIFKSN